ncbi:MAG: sulfatase [Anaerolineae bacterium]|nr:sulfatase [Anaerolineae bacterium]
MNVVLISLDSLRSDAVGCYGNESVPTPRLDRLASSGALFQNTIVQTPYTIPSHATMLTGLYPFNHRLRDQVGQRLTGRARTIFTALQAHGYQNASFLGARIFGTEHGYTDWNLLGAPEPHLVNRAVRKLRPPFFLFVHYWDLHVPYRILVPPKTLRDRAGNLVLNLEEKGIDLPRPVRYRLLPKSGPHYIRRIGRAAAMLKQGHVDQVLEGYYRSVRRADTFVGGIVDELDARGLLSDTLLIVTSDHGDSFNEHDEIDRAPAYPNAYVHGHFLFDNVLKVPLILHYPARLSQTVVTHQVELVDIVPTIYDLTGVDLESPPPYLALDGVSMLPLVENEPWPPRKKYAYSETRLRDSDSVSVRTERYKLILDHQLQQQALYDLVADPAEDHDISARNPEVVQELLDALAGFQAMEQDPEAGDDHIMPDDEYAAVHNRLEALGYV